MARLYSENNGMYPLYAKLVKQTNENYKVAIAYYEQKKLAFKSALKDQGEFFWDMMINELGKKAQSFASMIKAKAEKCITNNTPPDKLLENGKEDEYYVYIKELFDDRYFNKGGKPQLNTYKLGFTFEKFLANHSFDSQDLKKALAFINQQTNSLLQNVGAIQQYAYTTGRVTDTRTDIALTSGEKIGQMELIKELDLEQDPPAGMSMTDFLLSEIANSDIDVNIAGFQVKAYEKGSDQKRWQNSQVIADRITNLFNAANARTWAKNYVINYPTWFISKYLINVINPVNIGLISMGGIEYMDEWLAKYRLYMEVSWREDTGKVSPNSNRGGGTEVRLPYVAQRTILSSSIEGFPEKGTGNYRFQGFAPTGSMRQATYDKSIKVAGIKKIK